MGDQRDQLTPFGHALAGALGSVFANSVVYPLDTVKTRIQAGGAKIKTSSGAERTLGAFELLKQILKDEGFAGVWAGYGATMLSTFSQSYAYFLAYTIVRGSYQRRLSRGLPKDSKAPPISTAMELILGALSGAIAQIFTIPVSVIATRQQIGSRHHHLSHPKDPAENTFLAVARDIVREDGIAGLWAGIKPGLVLTVNPAITYGVFERVKGLLLLRDGGSKLKPWMAFLVGALSKTLATVVTYPYIMAKIRLQARWGDDDDELIKKDEVVVEAPPTLTSEVTGAGSDAPTFAEVAQPDPEKGVKEKAAEINKRKAIIHHKYTGAIPLLHAILKKEGFSGLYQGMDTQITKAVLCQALLFMMKDQFEHVALFIQLFGNKVVETAVATAKA